MPNFYPSLLDYCADLIHGFDVISSSRKQQLNEIERQVTNDRRMETLLSLVFICTHNSRRSHLGQLWTAVAADYYDLLNIQSFSGGTESTALNDNIVTSLERAGFKIEKRRHKSKNPDYYFSWKDAQISGPHFSKTYDHETNPSSGFMALMVCSEADADCPIVSGASTKISLPYTDPKAYDGSPEEQLAYDKATRVIGTEIFYLINRIKQNYA